MEENSTPETEYQLTGNEECFTMQTPPGTQTPAGELTNKILLILTIAGIVIFGFFFPMLTCYELINRIHRTGSEQSDTSYDVLEAIRCKSCQHRFHTT